MSTFVSRRKYVYNSRLGFSILYKNAARPLICVSWQFTYTWKTLAWSINSQGMFGPIELVLQRRVLWKCLYQAMTLNSVVYVC